MDSAFMLPKEWQEEVGIENEKVTSAVFDAQAGLAGALGGIADAHNALVRRLLQARRQLDPLVEESGKVLSRLRSLEVQILAIPKELKEEVNKSAQEQKQMLENHGEEARLQQEELRRILSERIDRQVDASEQRQELFVNAKDKALKDRIDELDRVSRRLLTEQQEQALQQGRQSETWDRRFVALKIELAAKVESSVSEVAQKVSDHEERLRRTEQRLADHAEEIERQQEALEQRALASRVEPLDMRVAKAEQGAAGAVNRLIEEVAKLETAIDAAKGGLVLELQATRRKMETLAEEKAADVLKQVHADEGVRVTDLERLFRDFEKDKQTFTDRISRELSGTRNDVQSGREWCTKRIEAINDVVRQVEAMKNDGRKDEQFWKQKEQQVLKNMKEVEETLGRLDGGRIEELTRRQNKCDQDAGTALNMVKSLGSLLENIIPAAVSGNRADFSALVTSCLTCGQQRSFSPHGRNPYTPGSARKSPVACGEAALPAGAAMAACRTMDCSVSRSDGRAVDPLRLQAAPQDRGNELQGPGGLAQAAQQRRRPGSARKPAVACGEAALPTGAAMAACRMMDCSMSRPRPRSAVAHDL